MEEHKMGILTRLGRQGEAHPDCGPHLWGLLFMTALWLFPPSVREHSVSSTHRWLLCPWASPGKNTGVGWHSLLQGIFLTWDQINIFCTAKWILYHRRSQT